MCVCARMRDPRGVKAPLNFFPTLSPEADWRKSKCGACGPGGSEGPAGNQKSSQASRLGR